MEAKKLNDVVNYFIDNVIINKDILSKEVYFESVKYAHKIWDIDGEFNKCRTKSGFPCDLIVSTIEYIDKDDLPLKVKLEKEEVKKLFDMLGIKGKFNIKDIEDNEAKLTYVLLALFYSYRRIYNNDIEDFVLGIISTERLEYDD